MTLQNDLSSCSAFPAFPDDYSCLRRNLYKPIKQPVGHLMLLLVSSQRRRRRTGSCTRWKGSCSSPAVAFHRWKCKMMMMSAARPVRSWVTNYSWDVTGYGDSVRTQHRGGAPVGSPHPSEVWRTTRPPRTHARNSGLTWRVFCWWWSRLWSKEM